MIRMIQRRLIIPRGDTGSFSIPYLKPINAGDVAVFTIFDPRTHTKMYQKLVAAEGDMLNIAFSHGDTVNLKPGKYLWDIKFYTNPQFVDDELVNGDEIDSYYAGFTLPECEIRQTGDALVTSDDAPTSTVAPETLNIVNAAISEALRSERIAAEAAETTVEKAAEAAESATSAATSASAAEQSAALAVARVNEIENLSVEVSTGEEGTQASATYTPSTGVLSFEIPRGDTGNGIASCVLNADFTLTINYTDGTSMTTVPIRGDTPHLTIGQVTEGPNAIATITGTDANPVLNLTLPNANVPTKLSQLTDDIGVAGKANSADLATVATSGSYNDLTDRPTIPEVPVQDVQIDGTSILENGIASITTGSLSKAGVFKAPKLNETNTYGIAVSPTGTLMQMPASYPQIQEGLNNYRPIVAGTQNRAVFYGLAKAAGDSTQSSSDNAIGTYTDEAKSAIQQMLDVPSTSDVPTQVSELTNDAGYLTTETDPTVPAWAKAAQKPTYTAAEVGAPTVAEMQQAIANVNTMKMHICTAAEYNTETGVPTIQNPDTQTLYLVPGGEGNNLFIEWAYVNSAWERFGSADVDLSDYVKISTLDPSPRKNSSNAASSGGIYNALTYYVGTTEQEAKTGTIGTKTVTPAIQHASAFYGLAKAAGDTTQSQSDNAIGTYTDEAKAAIQQMLDVPSTSDIPAVPVQDVQIIGNSIVDAQGIANFPMAQEETYGVVKLNTAYGLYTGGGYIRTLKSPDAKVKEGIGQYQPIVPYNQHLSTFYGLAKAAGADEKDSTLPVGTYTDTAKSAIRTMLGAASSNIIAVQDTQPTDADTKIWLPETAENPVQVPTVAEMNTALAGKVGDVQVNGTSIVQNGVANVPVASRNNLGVIQPGSDNFLTVNANGVITVSDATEAQCKSGASRSRAITPFIQNAATFYGLAKAAGDTTQAASDNAVGTYTDDAKTAIRTMLSAVGDVQVDGTSIVTNGIANVPIATTSTFGAVKCGTGLSMMTGDNAGKINTNPASTSACKNGAEYYAPITPNHQHEAAFYGLAKAAGDTTQSASSNAVGTYTENAKASIKSMLGIVDGSTGTVEVSGAAPTITAVENTRYVCGEITSLTLTPSASGICIVRFTSGSSQTLLTIPSTVKFPEWFDPTSLETNTIYEICVTDGIYGAVMSWAQ